MPSADDMSLKKTIEDVVREVGLYPIDAYRFVQEGLSHTVDKLHGQEGEQESKHITGPQLCQGLRDFALEQYGLLAPVVLRRWNITTTLDFGRIVFAMVESKLMSKTENDKIDDFRNVFDFRTAFETGYKIEMQG